jgi:hypothetical protein
VSNDAAEVVRTPPGGPIPSRTGSLLPAWLLLLAAVGCGPPEMGQVSGMVTFKGKPLPMAVIRFQPESRPMAVGVTDNQGRYRLSTKARFDGAYGGRHVVTISPWVLGFGQEPLDPAYVPPPLNRGDIPEKYRIGYTSPLSADVVAGRDNTIDFELAP